jgi:hypothetical protein
MADRASSVSGAEVSHNWWGAVRISGVVGHFDRIGVASAINRRKGRCEMLAEVFQESGSGFIVLIPIAVLLGVGALIGSLWTRAREQKR